MLGAYCPNIYTVIPGNSTVLGSGYDVSGEMGNAIKIVLNSDGRIIGGTFGLGTGIGPNMTFLSDEIQAVEMTFEKCFTENGLKFSFLKFPFYPCSIVKLFKLKSILTYFHLCK